MSALSHRQELIIEFVFRKKDLHFCIIQSQLIDDLSVTDQLKTAIVAT